MHVTIVRAPALGASPTDGPWDHRARLQVGPRRYAPRQVDALSARCAAHRDETVDTGAALLAALNGVLGDHLVAFAILAITMSLRAGTPLALRRALASASNAQRKVLISHGLCMNDLQWMRATITVSRLRAICYAPITALQHGPAGYLDQRPGIRRPIIVTLVTPDRSTAIRHWQHGGLSHAVPVTTRRSQARVAETPEPSRFSRHAALWCAARTCRHLGGFCDRNHRTLRRSRAWAKSGARASRTCITAICATRTGMQLAQTVRPLCLFRGEFVVTQLRAANRNERRCRERRSAAMDWSR